MYDFIYFVIGLLVLFLIVPLICFFVNIKSKKLERLCRPPRCQPNLNHWLRAWQCTNSSSCELWNMENDRQGNNFPVAGETGRDNRYNEIFFIEPNSAEAARIRAQLEKDDKDLPSYEEVMRMTNLTTPTAAPATNNEHLVPAMPSALTMGASGSSVNTTDTTLSVSPYRPVESATSSTPPRPLTPPPYTPEPIGASVVLPITTPLHSQQQQQQPTTQSS